MRSHAPSETSTATRGVALPLQGFGFEFTTASTGCPQIAIAENFAHLDNQSPVVTIREDRSEFALPVAVSAVAAVPAQHQGCCCDNFHPQADAAYCRTTA